VFLCKAIRAIIDRRRGSITYARPRTSFRSIWTRLQRFACNDFASKSLLWLIMFDIESSLRELCITAGGNNEKFEG
jgi:hypothetical protein